MATFLHPSSYYVPWLGGRAESILECTSIQQTALCSFNTGNQYWFYLL